MPAGPAGIAPSGGAQMRSDRDGPFLEASGLTKSFDGNVVLSGVDLVLRKGEVHAIVGENGAGKSTLIKTLGGVHRPDAGRLLVDGQDTVLRSPADAIARGIVVIHQELSLAPHLSVAENIFLGHFLRNRIGLVDRRRMHDETRALLTRLHIDIDPKTLAVDLPIAQQQMVEIAKAISFNAKVLILDEPTAVLDEDMVDTLFDLIATLKSQGIAIVFISHHLEEIFRIADTVTVLRDGKRTGLSAVAEVDQNWLVSRMIGRDFPAFLAKERSTGEPALEVRGLTLPGVFEDISFTAHKGEIVGLAGLVGAGRTEVARAICGITPASSGEVRVFGRAVRLRTPQAAMRLGMAYVTEDRKALGLLPNRSVRENATISNLSRFRWLGFLGLGKERSYVSELIRKLDIRLAGMDAEIRTLSGGNQQKVLLGRALAVDPRILVFDEPTRGVDIGAKSEIYAIIEQLVSSGMCVILISSELEEILRLADKVVVLRRGRVATTLSRAQASESAIMHAAALAG
jgi:ABC-type sugar transport system ATPase subunit